MKRNRRYFRRLFSAGLAICLALGAAAYAGNPVVATLSAKRIITTSGGPEKFVSAEEAKPGDVIEYKAVYKNESQTAIANLEATVPIPLGVEYLTGSAKPAIVSASIDGKNFGAVPLTRKVTGAAGKTASEPVPTSEYRSLRWKIGELGAGASTTVSARAKVTSTLPAK